MNIKQYKQDLENKVVETLKSLVNETVMVQANYDINKDSIAVLLIEEHKKEEVRESLVVYSCNYIIPTNQLSVTGFMRRYGYDGFGIAQIINDPITVEDSFINGMKNGLQFALQPQEMAADTVTE